MYRLIASDMDGTLLNAHGALSPRTRKAVRRCMEAGALFALSSGRMPEAVRETWRDVGSNAPAIVYNGAMIYDFAAGETLFRRAVSADVARAICRMAEGMGLYIQAYPGEGYFCREHTELTAPYEKRIGVKARDVGIALSEWISGDVLKLLAMTKTPEEAEAACADLRGAFSERADVFRSVPTYIEIVARGIDKGQALAELRSALGVEKEEVLAFGDGQNDVPMLLEAGAGYAMESSLAAGVEGLLRAPPYDDDGVARVLEALLDQGMIGGKQ